MDMRPRKDVAQRFFPMAAGKPQIPAPSSTPPTWNLEAIQISLAHRPCLMIASHA
jgi:hypothetical protein